MILPILMMFQILFGGSLYATNVLINLRLKNQKFKKFSTLFLHMLSQITLQRVVTTFHLSDEYFNKFSLINTKSPLKGKQLIVHQERVHEIKDFKIEEEPQIHHFPTRKYSMDQYKLYFPDFLTQE
eukprot:gene2039-1546_t